jgi:xanthine dehydrogenase accessory factor
VIETNRGHGLGRAIYEGSAEPDTGQPGAVGGKTHERILRAPVTGVVEGKVAIGERVAKGQLVATVGGHAVRANTTGVLRGMVRSGTHISRSVKIGDVDPRAEPAHCALISDKALAIAGGVVEAILAAGIG